MPLKIMETGICLTVDVGFSLIVPHSDAKVSRGRIMEGII